MIITIIAILVSSSQCSYGIFTLPEIPRSLDVFLSVNVVNFTGDTGSESSFRSSWGRSVRRCLRWSDPEIARWIAWMDRLCVHCSYRYINHLDRDFSVVNLASWFSELLSCLVVVALEVSCIIILNLNIRDGHIVNIMNFEDICIISSFSFLLVIYDLFSSESICIFNQIFVTRYLIVS